ncbi:bifunctional hydroxymethylpyrimidine kinase/phosphomethylpyrimidine kinase [Vibrio sp. Y2-5]|uniref:bifunctional hydroxymethylpyrimidine kinase/phosphomethylpyrimidine kinase n=1 Tax=Vibrio sp. Y2-5 TaxID=2743977 RepID=UPI001660B3A0|nr:bifunctional hydroxymethylpyrimidine kinase/phosphomethylpyrimidine kinase [Vibrio sp. Y2-5]MBD0785317.1 bifunctional hydroxymethylpyrimidine kinase/phosphomethylpyrimidine kinase [Vibrio sp. Y2-5]
MPKTNSIPVVLTIAGSDSGGGAGIQADIKAISATGSYAASVITAITSQNTLGVFDILPVPLPHIESQLDAVFQDLNIVSVKIGMLADSDIINLVADKLEQYRPQHIVLDTVMVATSGDLLLKETAIDSLKERLLPLASIITPNLPEAAALTGLAVPRDTKQIEYMVTAMRQLSTSAVLLKGGHLEASANSDDLLITQHETHRLNAERIHTLNTHGTGCTLSSAIASFLAQGEDMLSAVSHAKQYITQAIRHADSLNVGQGRGPVDHFFMLHQ